MPRDSKVLNILHLAILLREVPGRVLVTTFSVTVHRNSDFFGNLAQLRPP